MKAYFPFLEWLFPYDRSHFSGDLLAGLTVGVMLIPQGMAYAMLAGMPPIYGLYASTIPLIIYALMGTSRQLAVGPVAMVALLIASGVGQVASQGSTEYISYAILLAMMVGLIQLGMGLFRLGFIVNFLAHPVIAGFTSAAAIIIGVSQIKHLLGVSIERGSVVNTLEAILHNVGDTNLWTLLIGGISILILIVSKKLNKKIPAPLLVVVFGMAIVYFLGLDSNGVRIVKDIPSGLPSFSMISIDLSAIKTLLPIALTISFVGFMESIAVAKSIQNKHNDYKIVPNQELIALGLANIFGSFFKSFPVTGGFSRSAVNDQSGAKTGLASLISAALIILTLLFLTDYFYYLPNAVLSAIILVAVYGLIDFKEAKHLWKNDKQDFFLFIITAIFTLLVGIEEGILIGVILSIIMLIYRVSNPHIAELGMVPDTKHYRNIKRFNHLETDESTLILRLDAQLFFANIDYFKNELEEKAKAKKFLKYIIIHAGSIQNVDSSGVHALHDIVRDYREQGVSVILTNVVGPTRDILNKNGMIDYIGADNFHLTIADAVEAIHGGVKTELRDITLQSDIV